MKALWVEMRDTTAAPMERKGAYSTGEMLQLKERLLKSTSYLIPAPQLSEDLWQVQSSQFSQSLSHHQI